MNISPNTTSSSATRSFSHPIMPQWQAWLNTTFPASTELRNAVLARFVDCLENEASTLDLSSLELSSLPPLPDTISTLIIRNNPIESLPDTLPKGLRRLFANNLQLRKLPVRLPDTLTWLNVQNNHLTSLPETLSLSLERLYASHNKLHYLPADLPARLYCLDVAYNELEALPPILPEELIELSVENNQLTSLPSPLPANLQILDVSNNCLSAPLTSLPNTLRVFADHGNPYS